MVTVDVKSNGSSLDIGSGVYDVTPDGKRFLMVMPSEGATPTINLVLNWTADLKR